MNKPKKTTSIIGNEPKSPGESSDRKEFIYRAITDLHEDPENAMDHPDEQIALLKHWIKDVGFLIPVVIDKDLKIICGHARTRAAYMLGMKEVPTVFIGELAEEKKDAYALFDNAISRQGTWKKDKLEPALKRLRNAGFELPRLGFDAKKLVQFEASTKPAETHPMEHATISEAGDIWLLGTNKLICGLGQDAVECDATVRRWQNRTGRKAVLEATGETFDSFGKEAVS